MKHLSLFFTYFLFALSGAHFAEAQNVFINEIHYDNDGADAGEAVEIAGPAGTDLSGWSLVLYNGNGGTQYNTVSLNGSIPNQQGGYGTISFTTPGIQNGAPDGIALVNASNEVVQFLSYEGAFVAAEGVAAGKSSTDIGVEEGSSTPVGYSLQLTGNGTEYTHFSWTSPSASSWDAPNTGQTFSGSTGDGGEEGDGDSGEDEGEEPAETIAFINEIHYDNSGTDEAEGIEIAALAGTDLTGWAIELYNGSNGALYQTIPLTGTIEDQQAGWGTYFVAISGIQNGSPDGIALNNASGQPVQFLSYEGSFTAVGGSADGMLSEDIGVEETSSTPAGYSLQLTGEGSTYTDFSWSEAQPATYDEVNTGQVFLPIVPIVFINEIHYDNSGTDTNEGIEIAGTAGTDLSGYQLVLYNGNNGAPFNPQNLEGEIPNQDNGFGTLFFFIEGIQNGAPDGLALVEIATGQVVQFLSYEGSFTAVGGPADGMASEDIGVEETSATSVGQSLQLVGEGRNYTDFSWDGPFAQTYNQVNTNQSFGGEIVIPEPEEVSLAEARNLQIGKQVIVNGTLTATSQLGGPAFIQDRTGGIAVYDPQIHANDSLQIGDSIRVEATIGAFNNQIQLVDVTAFDVFGQATDPVQPKEVIIAELPSVEGELVTIQANFTQSGGLLFPNSNYQVQDETGTTDIRIDDNVESLIGTRVPEGDVSITGVVGSYQGNMQIFPRFASDLPAAVPFQPEGDTIPAAKTLDVATWNMEFFGATQDNFGPTDIQLQLDNAVKVIEALEADIIAVQEISSDSLLAVLAGRLEGNWATVCSDVFSYSFAPADPSFPDQRLCYLYNTEVIEVLNERVVFEEFYTQIRTTGDESLLPGYPTTVSSFWASGRLPYQLTVNATVDGVTERVHLFNIHGISNSGGMQSYLRRLYDVQVLKDTLDTYYANEQLIILGDYNDDVDEPVASEVSSDFSPYEVFVEDPFYAVATQSLTEAGFRSYITQDNVIDHITISDELFSEWIEGSETTFLPFRLIPNYLGTTSDHLPVLVRFELLEPMVLTLQGDQQVYYGYSPEECTTLTATATGGRGTLSYSWSTGETTSSIEVCPNSSQVYTLTVTDEAGNTATEELFVCVTDVSCGTFLRQNKVELCKPVGRSGKYISLCLPEHLVEFFLERDAVLGSCNESDCDETPELLAKGNRKAKVNQQSGNETIVYSIDEELSVRQDFARHQAEVQFVVLEEGHSKLSLYNASGKLMKILYNGSDEFGQLISLPLNSQDFQKGFYYLKLETASGAVFTKKLML